MENNPIELKIKAIYRDISRKEQQIADYILNFPEKLIHQSIKDVSQRLDMAESTIFRFCQRLGYGGFKEFKIELARVKKVGNSLEIEMYEGISSEDSPLMIASKVFKANQQALADTVELINDADFTDAVTLLVQSQTVSFFGIGGSNVIALDAYHKFLRSPLEVKFATDYHIQLMEATRLGTNDCAVLISHSGQSKDILQLAQQLKQNGTKLIVITSFLLSPLANLADICLLSTSKEVEFRPEALASRITQLSLIDALFVSVMYQNQAKSEISLDRIRQVISVTKEE